MSERFYTHSLVIADPQAVAAARAEGERQRADASQAGEQLQADSTALQSKVETQSVAVAGLEVRVIVFKSCTSETNYAFTSRLRSFLFCFVFS
eukprot:COSAG05_NODE_1682_length_4285_cov_33.861682_6_plen_93_part_00